jgi:20S proteasome alpha/beta subunit
MKYAAETDSGGIIYKPSFMMIGSGIQVVLRLLPNNLKGCNVGVTEGQEVMNYALKMASGGMT